MIFLLIWLIYYWVLIGFICCSGWSAFLIYSIVLFKFTFTCNETKIDFCFQILLTLEGKLNLNITVLLLFVICKSSGNSLIPGISEKYLLNQEKKRNLILWYFSPLSWYRCVENKFESWEGYWLFCIMVVLNLLWCCYFQVN